MHFSFFYAIFAYCKRELLFKQKPSYPTVDLSLDFVVLSSYRKCFAYGYITINAFWGQSAELYLESIVTKIYKNAAPTHPYQRWKNIREKIINQNIDMDRRWTTTRIHLWVQNMQTHVKLFCCGSAQMIMKIDFQQIIIF